MLSLLDNIFSTPQTTFMLFSSIRSSLICSFQSVTVSFRDALSLEGIGSYFFKKSTPKKKWGVATVMLLPLAIALLSFPTELSAQQTVVGNSANEKTESNVLPKKESNYSYVDAFQPLFYPQAGNVYRTASGKPGPSYWQNKADYQIEVALDTVNDKLTGKAIITYTNNSPEELPFLFLHLDQNLFKKDSRGSAILPPNGSRYDTKGEFTQGGHQISAVQLLSGKSKRKAERVDLKFEVVDTRMQVFLPEPVRANGGVVRFEVGFSYVSPAFGADRTGIQPTKNGKIYTIAQWYPRMCVFDDVLGWNAIPYTGPGEFYLTYGDFELSITAPANHMVVSSGALINPSEVLTNLQQQRWRQAEQSDKTVMIRTAEEVTDPGSRPTGTNGLLTWKFSMKNSRDVAFASSAAFILDGAKIKLPEGKTALALSAYPVESNGNNGWERSTEYTKASIEHYSEKWYPYPYPAAVNVAGNEGGMEYPGIVFCSYRSRAGGLWGVTDHEFGHTWYPMIVGSNERLYGWMAEGFNSFINELSTEAFNNGEYKSRKPNMQQLGRALTNSALEPVMTTPAGMKENSIGLLLYFKPAVALGLLRDKVLGPERFDRAFRHYTETWAFKHPTPWDFFRSMEYATGENLNWFWRGWFLNNWKLDQGVNSVNYIGENPEKGALITFENYEKMAMPLEFEIEYVSGKKQVVKLPVEIWERTKTYVYKTVVGEKIRRVTIDPLKEYPDFDPSNNQYEVKD